MAHYRRKFLSVALPALLLAAPALHAGRDTTQEEVLADYGSLQPKAMWIQDPYTGDTVLATVREPSTLLWNGARVEDYHESMQENTPPPLGVLTIPEVGVQVAVWNGTQEVNLNRGAGRIRGMAQMGEEGNLGISSHRDGFFRNLKFLEEGDDILLQTPQGVEKYAVTSISIVHKEDFSPLADSDEKMITLVTCYPFYYVGNAPDRMIVKAYLRQPDPELGLAEEEMAPKEPAGPKYF